MADSDNPVVGVKTGRSRVGGQAVSLRINGNKGQWGHDVYPGLGPLKGGKILCPAWLYSMSIGVTRVDVP